MSTVNNVTNNPVVQQLMQGSGSSASSSDDSSVDGLEDRFLTLLVTQMQNQDPLNPMENAELTSQLAQINTVKGIAGLNATLDKLLTSYSDALSMQSAALVGKNVLSAGNKLSLTEAGAIGGVNLAGVADQVTVTITSAAGAKVAEQKLGAQEAGVIDFYWDGKDLDGNAVAAGVKVHVNATQDGKKVDATALQFGTVSALVRTASGFQLEIPGIGQVDFGSVQQIY
jgi:flagellar basal-body rod modification protein FlgD